MNKIMGIYVIHCLKNDNRYVGATTNLSRRKLQHFSDLKLRKHRNPRLQADYNLYGKNNFIFSVVEILRNEKNLLDREQFWIDIFQPFYNAEMKSGSSTSHVKNSETREKISSSVGKLWEDSEYRSKHCKPRNWKNGVPNRKGAKLSEETREKLRQANLGRNNPNYGKHKSESTKQKIGAKSAKTYVGAVSPNGTIYSPIINMSEFCRKHGLVVSSMISVMHDRRSSYKGWTKLKE